MHPVLERYVIINISSTSGYFVVGSCDISLTFPVLTVGKHTYHDDREQKPITGSCEHGIELSASITNAVLTCRATISFKREDSVPWSPLFLS
jgi:hypothetical protein